MNWLLFDLGIQTLQLADLLPHTCSEARVDFPRHESEPSGASKKEQHTLWWTNIAIENGHLWWIFPLKIVIFHCYVSSPEGNSQVDWKLAFACFPHRKPIGFSPCPPPKKPSVCIIGCRQKGQKYAGVGQVPGDYGIYENHEVLKTLDISDLRGDPSKNERQKSQ